MNNAIKFVYCYLLTAGMLLIANFSYGQLTADFTADVTKGCSPLIVNFTDASTGNPTSWKWDFGNGTPAVFGKSVSTTYTNPGSYQVTLTVSDGVTTNTVIKTNFIIVPAPPAVAFTSDKNSGCFPQTIQFTDQTNDPSGSVTNWLWDFGDGNIDSVANPVHTYSAPGQYNVTLSIKDQFGCENTLTKPKFINIQNGALADFSNSVSASCNPPENITFQNLSSGSGTLSYTWNFGDGSPVSTTTSPSHLFTNAGKYIVLLTVSSSAGCSDTASKEITIGQVKADFDVTTALCHGKPIKFTNKSLPAPSKVSWYFGDGTSSNQFSPSKIYTQQGDYQVKMVADFGGCVDSVIKTVTVKDKYPFDFSYEEVPNCAPPLVVNFTSELNGGKVYKWLFGDGGISTLPNPTHSFNKIQSYSVTLIIINPSGCFDTLRKSDYITYKRPSLRINDLPAEGCAPFTTTFSSRLNFKDSITSYSWTFGDGGNSTDSTPSHTYLNVGVYRVKLTVTTALGCTLTTSKDSGALAGVKPKADFKGDQFDVCASVPITFTDLSTGGANAWIWDFGDGEKSTEQNPIHQYMDTGFFSIKLIAKNTGCPDSIVRQNYIHIKPPVPIFTVNLKCDEPFKRTFKNSSLGADDFLWDFGDGSPTSTAKVPPPHVFKDTGVYNVSLTVNNFSNGCSNVFTMPVYILLQKADFISLTNNVCKGNPSIFTTKGINPDYIKKYQWDFGDGIEDREDNDTVTHVFQSNGLYNISLKITDILGCKDSTTKLNFTKIEGPTVFFTHPTGGSCLNQETTFIDSSQSDGTHPIVKWVWNYGDGTIAAYTAPPFTHTYSAVGIYSVSLTVFDSNGCLDSLTRDSYFEISVPKADFMTSDTSSCPGKPIQFSTLSTGPLLQYIWDFGDGSPTSSSPNPLHTYSANGIYSIKLSIIDAYGCTDSITKTNFIDITTPNANFIASDSVSECSPFQVIFTNNSTNFRTALWDFGDGGSSVRLDGADHVYTLPGTYTVKLTITGPGGCTDEHTMTILVKGPQGSFTTSNIKGCNSLTTKFVATTKGTTSLIWDFGDGQILQTRDSIVEHTYTFAGNYFPKVILLDANCRVPVLGADTLSVYITNAGFVQSSTLACNTGSVSFTDTSKSNDQIISYNWNFGDGTTSMEQNPSHVFLTPGTYFVELTVTTAFGCTSTYRSTEPIKIVASPQIQITGDSAGCIPASLTFKGELVVPDTSAISWQWDFANGTTSNLQQPPTQVYPTAGNYIVNLIATNSSGCKDTAFMAVTAYPIPVVTAIRDTFVCIGNSVTLQASGASTYVWSPSTSLSCTNCETTIANPTDNITYTVTGTSEVGCSASDELEVLVKKPFTISVSPPDSVCLGSGVTISATGADVYLWSPATGLDDPAKSDPFASPIESTNYVVTGSDDKGCFTDTKSVALSVFPLPTVNVGPDVTINIGQTTTIRPQISADVVDYTWTPTTGIISSSDSGITVKPVMSTEYSLLVTNNGNCKAEDKVTVFVICNNANVYIPNTFSPNKDGINDWFYPRGTGLFKIRSLKIFNRWGEMVYQKANLTPNLATDGWNGTYKNKALTPDVFIYQIDIICENGSVLSYKGNIALIR